MVPSSVLNSYLLIIRRASDSAGWNVHSRLRLLSGEHICRLLEAWLNGWAVMERLKLENDEPGTFVYEIIILGCHEQEIKYNA